MAKIFFLFQTFIVWNIFADGNYEGIRSFSTEMQEARTGAMQLDNEIFLL